MTKLGCAKRHFATHKVNSEDKEELLFYSFESDDEEFEGLWENSFWFEVNEKCDCYISEYESEELKSSEQKRNLIKLIERYQKNGCDFKMLKILKDYAEESLKHNEDLRFIF